MKLHVLLIIGFALSVTGCDKKEQAAPGQTDDAQTTAPPAESAAAEDPAIKKSYQYDGFLEHMHAHADQIDEINMALSDGDLDAARKPAAWLSRHEPASGIPAEWQPYLDGMREAARLVEGATDLEAATAASILITEQCQGCHTAAGIISSGAEQEAD
jgi:soluble cytochrome b562